jgi:precorrin-6B methylase 2
MRISPLAAAALALVACAHAPAPASPAPPAADAAQPQAQTPAHPPAHTPDVPFVPTPPAVVDEMLRRAEAKPGDVVYDLGCGDGRIAIRAVQKFGVRRAVCVDIDPDRVAEARRNAEGAGVADRVEVREQDLFDTDLGEATVVTLYLLPALNLKLRPTLQRLRPGTRIVSHAFDMGDWAPEQEVQVEGRTVYRWTVGGKGAQPPQARTPTSN